MLIGWPLGFNAFGILLVVRTSENGKGPLLVKSFNAFGILLVVRTGIIRSQLADQGVVSMPSAFF